MENQELIKKFYEITAPNGINISKRHKESYWRKYGHGDVYDLIMERTSFLVGDIQLVERIFCIKNNITEHPSCVTCGKPVMFVERKRFSEFCSKECMFKDPNISGKRKESLKKVDKEAAKNKRKQTMLDKYGCEYNSQRAEVKEILTQSKIKFSNPFALERLISYEWMFENYVTKKRNLVDIGEELGVYYGTVGDYCARIHGFEIRQRTNYSRHEVEMGEFIESLGFSYRSDRKVLDGYEIDLFIEDKQFGIEIDGAYWHSYDRFESKEEREKHLNKTLIGLEKGVKIIHVLDTEWMDKKDIIKSMIKSRLGVSSRIYARECDIRLVNKTEARKFLDDNHIQGSVGSSLDIGLYHNDILVMLMTFGAPRFNKNYSWELIRLASLQNTNVVGGASRLFKYFSENNDIGNGVICYSDRRFGEGTVYQSLGFDFERTTGPGYYWTDGDVVWSRTRFQKHKLEGLLKVFDENLSEAENMFANRYRRLWDCGNNVFVYTA